MQTLRQRWSNDEMRATDERKGEAVVCAWGGGVRQ